MTNDPKTYRELSQPFESIAHAESACSGFQEELGELRKKYKIRDVVAIMYFAYTASNGDESEAIISGQWGDQMRAEAMLAHGLGVSQAERQNRIGTLLRQAIRKGVRD